MYVSNPGLGCRGLGCSQGMGCCGGMGALTMDGTGIFGTGTASKSSSGVVSSGIVEPGFAAAGGGNSKTGPFTQYQTAPVGSVQSHQPGQTAPEKASSWLNIFGL